MKNILRITLEIVIVYSIELLIGYLIALFHPDLKNLVANAMVLSFGYLLGVLRMAYKKYISEKNNDHEISYNEHHFEFIQKITSRYTVDQKFFCGEFITSVWDKQNIIKQWRLKPCPTQKEIDDDLEKANNLIEELKCLKY